MVWIQITAHLHDAVEFKAYGNFHLYKTAMSSREAMFFYMLVAKTEHMGSKPH